MEDFAKILKLRGKEVRRKTITPTAAFPINKHRNLQLDVYERTFFVWLEVAMSGELKKVNAQDGLNYYDLGVRFNVNSEHVLTDKDDLAEKRRKRNAMKVAVHRLLAKADALIANVELGIFPSDAPVVPKDRWTPNQLKRLEKAVANGAWKPKLMMDSDWATELKQVHAEEKANRELDSMFGPARRR